MVQLTAGDYPADLGAGNLEENAEGGDPGIGVQHCVKRPNEETCRDDKSQRIKLRLKLHIKRDRAQAAAIFLLAVSRVIVHCPLLCTFAVL